MKNDVLVVETHPDLRSAIVDVLTRADFNCDAVSTAPAALTALREHDYGHIVVDIDSTAPMTALCAALSSQPALRAKLVLISDAREASKEMPDQAPLQKPFDTRQLLARLT